MGTIENSSYLDSKQTLATAGANVSNSNNMTNSTHLINESSSAAVNARNSPEKDSKSTRFTKVDSIDSIKSDDGDEEEDADVPILSNDKRYQRRSTIINLVKKECFNTNLAVDLKTGREVLWNVIDLSAKNFTNQEIKSINDYFKVLVSAKSMVYTAKYLAYWVEEVQNQNYKGLKFYLITENFGSISLNHFLKSIKTKVDLNSWSKWSRQILLGINFLHSNNPPIVHGNINSHTLYFDHSGLLKICFVGFRTDIFSNKFSVEFIKKSVEKKPFNYDPPDFKRFKIFKKSLDIFDFGLVALKIAVTPLTAAENHYTPYKYIDLIENSSVKKMIRKCLSFNSNERPSVQHLLRDQAIFIIPKLSSLILSANKDNGKFVDSYWDRMSKFVPNQTICSNKTTGVEFKFGTLKWLETRENVDIIKQNHNCSLILMSELRKQNVQNTTEHESITLVENDKPVEEEKYECETRRIIESIVNLDPQTMQLDITVTFNDTKRNFSTKITKDEVAIELAEDLVLNGVLNEYDINIIASQIQTQQSELLKN